MSINPKEKESDYIIAIDNKTIQSIQNTLMILEEKFDLRWKHQDMQFKSLDVKFTAIDQRFDQVDNKFKDMDKKLDKIDARFEKLSGRLWQIIMLLLAYPLGLIVGKLCHVF